jgi:hypothetical protein
MISITTEKETTIDVKLIDINGKTLYTASQKATNGTLRIIIRDLQRLLAGVPG